MDYAEHIQKKKRLGMSKKEAETFPRVKSNDLGQHVVAREERYLAIYGKDKSKKSNGHILASSYDDTNSYSPDLVSSSRKRSLPGIESNQNEKKRKISRIMIKQCSSILKHLMTHPFGWIFNQPVDPVKLNIPDYFSIVTEPMDFGTVMAKLDKSTYSSVEEFEADVRLTFSNAILYNPPGSQVHNAAKKLNHAFDIRWRLLEAKWTEDQENPNFVFKPCRKETDADISCQINHANLRIDNGSFTEKPATAKPERMQKDCRKQSVRNIVHEDGGNKAFPCPENAKRSTQPVHVCDSCGSMKCQCRLHNNGVRAFSSDLSSERSGGRDLGSLIKTKPIKMQKDCRKQSVRNIVHEDGGNKAFPCPNNAKRSSQLVHVCDSCGSIKCQCHLQNNGVHAFSSDLSSERSGGLDDGSLRKDSKSKSMSASQDLMKPVPDSSDGDDASSLELKKSYVGIQLTVSPKKALRTAMLLARYSELIVKTMHGKNADPVKMQEEKCRLERQQLIEKKRIEDEMRAAEMQRQKEIAIARESARLALEKMEATIDMDDNLYNYRELEKWCNCSESDPALCSRKVLQSIGLFIKEDSHP